MIKTEVNWKQINTNGVLGNKTYELKIYKEEDKLTFGMDYLIVLSEEDLNNLHKILTKALNNK